MTAVTRADVENALKGYVDPYLDQDLIAAKCVKAIQIDGSRVALEIELGFPALGYRDALAAALRERLAAVPGVSDVAVKLESKIVSHEVQKGLKPLPGVKNIIAVASGKGGVGKSTTAVNLALGLQANGLRVGILDADIYGPSMPRLLKISGKPSQIDGRMIRPMENYGLKVMSMGFLVDEETAMIWRGPMVQSALMQLLRDVAWNDGGDLDVLVIDMPPGTGDAQLTLAQKVKLAGAVIVSTPQDIALIDARKGLEMFHKVSVPVLGIVENMSYYCCPACGHRADIFGHGGARAEAAALGVPFLGEVPLHADIRKLSDEGAPIVATSPDSHQAEAFRAIADQVVNKIETARRPAPRIVIES